jgi:hypothetical protein
VCQTLAVKGCGCSKSEVMPRMSRMQFQVVEL